MARLTRRDALVPLLTLVVVACVALLVSVAPGAGKSARTPAKQSVANFEPAPDASSPEPEPRSPEDDPDAPPPGDGWITAQIVERTHLYAAPGGRRLARLRTKTEFGSGRVYNVTRIRPGWVQVIPTELKNGRRGWVARKRVVLRRSAWDVRIDLSERRMLVRRDRRRVLSTRVAVGRPGTPTPTGRFGVTDKLRVTRPGSPYGCCAIALTAKQPKIPQGWGGGDRVAIHATTAPESIGTAASLGCVRAPTRAMKRLLRDLPLGSPVFVRR